MISPQTVMERAQIECYLDKMLQEKFRGEAVWLHTGLNCPPETEMWVLQLYGAAWEVRSKRGHNKELSFEFSNKRS